MSLATVKTLSSWSWRQVSGDETNVQNGSANFEWRQCAHNRPTTEIFTDLLDAGRIPDPFIDENERLVQWVADADWEYACNFDWSVASDQNHSRQDLVFEGLDTFAIVSLNGQPILTSENMFHRHRVDVTGRLKPGENSLTIVFHSALRKGAALEKQYGTFRTFNGDSSRVHVRKAQYHYGWDWGPHLVSCGPYREIRLESYACQVVDVFAHAEVAEDLQTAALDVSWKCLFDSHVVVEVTVTAPGDAEPGLAPQKWTESTHCTAKSTEAKTSFEIRKPALWSPLGHGPQVFYKVALSVRKLDGTLLQTASVPPLGLRRVRLVQKPLLDDEPGASFFFEVNNAPVYVSGYNWIPAHSFLTALTDADYEAAVDACVQSNQNMLRVWGGGIYEHEAFYRACDRRGVMVWQDFMFACAQYPYYESLAASIAREAADQLCRLRNYCSIVLYAGNNEDYQVAEVLGLAWRPEEGTVAQWTASNFPGRAIYEDALPAAMARLAPGVPYHPGSPWGAKRGAEAGGKGSDEDSGSEATSGPLLGIAAPTEDRTVGDIHQWNVWHGSQEPYQLWDKLAGRFVSEFGMLALPSGRTVRRFVSDRRQRYPQSAVMDWHNKADGAERRLALYVLENVRVGSLRLDSWIYATQLIQAECLHFALGSFRRLWKGPGREFCGGQLIWQINDCWPVASWAVMDYYGDRKLAFYAVKRQSAPVVLGLQRTTPKMKLLREPPPKVTGPPTDFSRKKHILDVWAANSSLKSAEGDVELRFFNVHTGALLRTRALGKQALAANQATELLADEEAQPDIVVQALLRQGNRDGAVMARASDWPQPLKHILLPDSYDIKVHVSDGRVDVTTNAPVKSLELYLEDEARSVCWDDNGIDVFPGDVYTVLAPGLRRDDKVEFRYYGSDWKE